MAGIGRLFPPGGKVASLPAEPEVAIDLHDRPLGHADVGREPLVEAAALEAIVVFKIASRAVPQSR